MYDIYSYHYQRRLRRLLWPVLVLVLMAMALTSLAVILIAETPDPGVPLRPVVGWSMNDPGGILRAGIPLLARVADDGGIPPLVSPGAAARPLLGLFTVDRQEPLQIIQSQVPLLEVKSQSPNGETTPVVAREEPEVAPLPDDEQEAGKTPVELSPECLVAVYFTHTGETYALTDGMERLHGKKGGVVRVGQALQAALEQEHGIRVALSENINDTNYGASYVESQATLRQLLEDNPSVQVVLDIHRDAGKSRENSLVTVHGQEVAPVLIVVGSDARDPFPTWRENYDFARELAAEIEKQHPGLCLGVQIKEGRYNQFLHPRAVLLEVGSVSNSTEEAVQTGRLLAGPVAEMVKRCLDGNIEAPGPQT